MFEKPELILLLCLFAALLFPAVALGLSAMAGGFPRTGNRPHGMYHPGNKNIDGSTRKG